MSDADPPRLSVIVPAFNEAQRLSRTLPEMIAHFGSYPFAHEVLIVIEHSSDGTLELATRLTATQANFQVIDNGPQRGKGFAVRSGVQRARGRFVFYIDADLSVPLKEIDRFLKYFELHPEHAVLIGNRQNAGSVIEQRQSRGREAMGKFFNQILRTLSPLDLKDTQCGFKAFRDDAARAIFSRQTLNGFALDVEVLLLAKALGYSIADLPVRWKNSPESKVHIVRDSARMLWDTIRLPKLIARNLRAMPVVISDQS